MNKLHLDIIYLIFELNASCYVFGIKHLNLKKLSAYNSNIKNVNHMAKSLVELNVSGKTYGIDDSGIKQINLIKLCTNNNPKITNINHMNKLIELYACDKLCGIDNEGIKNLNLNKLYERIN
jgi:hypothetical protein